MAPHSDSERVGSCGGEALPRHARQPYGEGPGRSRSGPISIRSSEGGIPLEPLAANMPVLCILCEHRFVALLRESHVACR